MLRNRAKRSQKFKVSHLRNSNSVSEYITGVTGPAGFLILHPQPPTYNYFKSAEGCQEPVTPPKLIIILINLNGHG